MARDFRDAGVPLVRLAGLDVGASLLAGCNYLDPDMVRRKWSHFALAKGDILVSTSASLGHTATVGAEGVGAVAYTGLIRMRPRGGCVDAGFLRYILEGPEFQAQAEMVGAGSVIRHFGPTHLRGMSLTIPPRREQRAIAHILGTLDDKIELNRKMSATLEEMARALFKSWFVDFDPVRAKMEGRDTGLPREIAGLFPDRLVESELGSIPEGWEVAPMEDVSTTVRGRSYSSDELAPSTCALVTLKSFLRGGGYRPDGLKAYTGTYSSEQVIEPGEVVVACTDVTQAAEVIGRTAVVRPARSYLTLVASLDVAIMRPVAGRLTRTFLYFLGRTPTFVAHTYAHTSGTTVLHLDRRAIPSFRFALPGWQLVTRFESCAGPMLGRLAGLEAESEILTAVRDTLLPKLISGELRVGDAEAMVGDAT